MIKTLSRSLREYKKDSVLTILLSILEAAFEITIPPFVWQRSLTKELTLGI